MFPDEAAEQVRHLQHRLMKIDLDTEAVQHKTLRVHEQMAALVATRDVRQHAKEVRDFA